MTVVLAIRCSDGLVLASDTQITQEDRGVSFPAAKLHPLGDTAAWGGSGARPVLQDCEPVLAADATEILASTDPARELRTRVRPVFEHHYEHVIPSVPGQDTPQTPGAYLLAAGYTTDGAPFIVEVTPNVLVGRYEELGFHAIGSGAPLARQAGALLAHFRTMERDLDHGLVVAVRVLDALASTAPNVGGPIQVFRLRPDGAELLDDDRIRHLRGLVDRWVALERDSLDRLFD